MAAASTSWRSGLPQADEGSRRVSRQHFPGFAADHTVRISSVHLACPHSQSPIELGDLPSEGEITCVGCGSSFQLAIFSTLTWTAPTNPRMDKFEVLTTVGTFGTVVKAHAKELNRMFTINIPREQRRPRFTRPRPLSTRNAHVHYLVAQEQ
jgi:nitrite reductase/ring-hydroxylating ferredoxin subunit